MVTVHFFPSYQGNMFDENTEQEYNALAARVIAKHKVPVLDLQGHIMAQFKPKDKHPPYTKYEAEMATCDHPLHVPVVTALTATAR